MTFTATDTVKDINFVLTLTAADFTNDSNITGTSTAANVNMFPNGAGVGIEGGGGNERINGGQYMTMQISITGADAADVDSIAFTNLNIRYESNADGQDNRTLFDNDGNSVTYNLGSDPRGNYDATTLSNAGLNTLSLANIDDWELSYAALLSGTDGVTALGSFSIEYTTIPEPSAVALLGLGGLALILRKRR